MKTATLNGFEVCFPEIPEGATVYRVHQLKTAWLLTDVNPIPLPPGDWQLSRLSEVQETLAGEMVDSLPITEYGGHGPDRYKKYMNYDKHGTITQPSMLHTYCHDTAHASLVSWVRAQGVSDNDPYLLIKKND